MDNIIFGFSLSAIHELGASYIFHVEKLKPQYCIFIFLLQFFLRSLITLTYNKKGGHMLKMTIERKSSSRFYISTLLSLLLHKKRVKY
jgi:hypothetical protein